MSAQNIPVSVRAVEARVRRVLLKDGEILSKCRADSPWFRDLGEYYAFDFNNHLSRTDIDLAGLARELGVLRPGEAMRDH